MTQREFYEAVITESVNEELVAFAKAGIEKLNKTNIDRKAKPSKTQEANAPIIAAIETIIGDIPKSAAQIAEEVRNLGIDCSTQKASSLLRIMNTAGNVKSTDAKEKGKAFKVYTKVDAE